MAKARDSLLYTATFLCGESDPAAGRGSADAPLTPGSYATAIEIANVDPARKVAVILTGTAQLGGDAQLRGKDVEIELAPRGVLRIDGAYIRKKLLASKDPPVPEAPLLIMGTVAIDVDPSTPLDVTAVYSASGFAAGGAPNGFSMQVYRVAGVLLPQPKPRK